MATSIIPGVNAPVFGGVDPPDTFADIPAPERPPPWWDVAGAAFRTENTVGALSGFIGSNMGGSTPFDISAADIIGTEFERNPSLLVGIGSMEEFEARREYLERQRADRETLAASGATGFGWSMAAAMFDPINAIPFGAGFKGGSALRTVSRVSAGATGGAAIQEGVLYGAQDYRTVEESALGVAGAAVLGAAFGGFGAYLGRRSRTRQLNALRTMLDPETSTPVARRSRDLRRTLDEYEAERARVGDEAIEADVHAGAVAARVELEDLKTRTGHITDEGEIFVAKEDIESADAPTPRAAEEPPSRVSDEDFETAEVERMRSLKDERVADAVENAEAIRARYKVEGCGK